jgi:hypothetical protein
MKKILLQIIFVCAITIVAQAQPTLDDFGRIVLNSYLPKNMNIPDEAKEMLSAKLTEIATENGMSGSLVNPRFIISASVNIGTKDIISGPPQLVAQNLEISLFIGDASTNTKFSYVKLHVKGVGTNVNKAFIESIKSINPKAKEVLLFIEKGKNMILAHYQNQCNFIIKDALLSAKQGKYDLAIFNLSNVPEVCYECYVKCQEASYTIYQQMIDNEGSVKLNEAKMRWAAEQTPSGAEKVAVIVSKIHPMAACQSDLTVLISNIESKLKEDEKVRWQFKMKQYYDNIEMQNELLRVYEEKLIRDDNFRSEESQRVAILKERQSGRDFKLAKIFANNYKEVALEYSRNQARKVTYNIIW